MNNPDVKNSKFGYAHPLVGLNVEFATAAVDIESGGKIIRVQERFKGPIVRVQEIMSNQVNVAIAAPGIDGEQYCPLDEITRCR